MIIIEQWNTSRTCFMHGFQSFIMSEMFLDQKMYYWASNVDLAIGTEFVAGSGSIRDHDTEMNALESLYDRIRAKVDPNLPSRIGAIFLARNEQEGRDWMRIVNKSKLYIVELISGKPYLTDAGKYSTSRGDIGKPVRYKNIKGDELDSYYKSLSSGIGDDTFGRRSSLEDDATKYWHSGDSWWQERGNYNDMGNLGTFNPDYDIELPEVIVAKGSKLRVVKKVV